MNDPIRVSTLQRWNGTERLMGGPDLKLNRFDGDDGPRTLLRLQFSDDEAYFVDAEELERAVRAARILAERDEK